MPHPPLLLGAHLHERRNLGPPNLLWILIAEQAELLVSEGKDALSLGQLFVPLRRNLRENSLGSLLPIEQDAVVPR